MARIVFVALTLVLVAFVFSSEVASLPVNDSPALTIEQTFDRLIQNESAEEKKCAKLGEYCVVSDQCCNKRCLFYAAKCVT